MEKTAVYLPAGLKQALARLTEERGAPAPRLPLFRSTGPSIAEDLDDALDGFGRR